MTELSKKKKAELGLSRTFALAAAIFVPVLPYAYFTEPSVLSTFIAFGAAFGVGGSLAVGLSFITNIHERDERS